MAQSLLFPTSRVFPDRTGSDRLAGDRHRKKYIVQIGTTPLKILLEG